MTNNHSNKNTNPVLYGLMLALLVFAEYMAFPLIVIAVSLLGIRDIINGDTFCGNIRLFIGGVFLGWYIYSLIKEIKENRQDKLTKEQQTANKERR